MNQDPNRHSIGYSLENIKANEEIGQKFFEIETGILAISNFTDFFEKLLLSIEDKFGIPHVWMSIILGSEVSHVIEALESSELLKKRLNLVGKSTFMQMINDDRNPILVNEDLKSYYKLLPKSRKYFVKSLAVAPLVYEGNIIGSLNLGDYSASRFQPSMDSLFLSRLAVKISICLSNITAREKLNYLATKDSVTGLLNRREMDHTVEREFNAAKSGGTSLALICIDCNNLKNVNESYGYKCGDALLHYVASQTLKTIGKNGSVFRFTGDQFLIVLPKKTGKKALEISELLLAFFEEYPMKYNTMVIPVFISCAVASTADRNINSAAALLEKAIGQLYDLNKRNRNGTPS